jgi:hypothetical protein
MTPISFMQNHSNLVLAPASKLAAYQKVHTLFMSCSLRPQLQRLDNEASHALLQFMDSQNIDVQLSPPYVHRRNAAERAIRTFKNHFIAGLCSTDSEFPMNLWDHLLPQAIGICPCSWCLQFQPYALGSDRDQSFSS